MTAITDMANQLDTIPYQQVHDNVIDAYKNVTEKFDTILSRWHQPFLTSTLKNIEAEKLNSHTPMTTNTLSRIHSYLTHLLSRNISS